MSRVLHPTRHIKGHFRHEFFQAITCTGSGTDKQKPNTQNQMSYPYLQ